LKPEKEEKSSKLPLFLTLGVVLSILAAYFFWPAFGETVREGWEVLLSGDQEKISDWVMQFGFWGPFFIILFMVLQMFLFVVNVMLLIIVAVLAYGPVWGSLLSLSGIVIASVIGYFVGKVWGSKIVHKFIGRKTTAKVETAIARYGIWAVVIARVSPFLSNDAISFIAGAGNMPFLKYMGATIVGITPLIIFIAWLGDDLEKLKTGLIWVTVVTILGFIIYYFYDRNRRKKAGKIEKQ
jgi:uncharacterized membrane protein YdjX (TVP38/TMEM64 family)